MLSPAPFIGASGYPLVFATGETANGRTPLIDRQHPPFAVTLGFNEITLRGS